MGCSTVGLSTKRMKAEVDTLTQQKGRTTNLPEDFVNGYYPNDDFDYVRRDVKSWSENPVNSLGGGFEVVRGNSYPTGGDVHGHKSHRCLKCKVIGCNWSVRYEWTTDAGWVLCLYSPHKNSMNPLPTVNHHNHSLLVSQAEVRAQRGAARGIPPELDFTCQVMGSAHATASEILRVVDKYSKDNQIDVTECSYS